MHKNAFESKYCINLYVTTFKKKIWKQICVLKQIRIDGYKIEDKNPDKTSKNLKLRKRLKMYSRVLKKRNFVSYFMDWYLMFYLVN